MLPCARIMLGAFVIRGSLQRLCAVSSSSALSAEDVSSCCHMLMEKGKDDGEIFVFVFSKETLGCAERCQGKNQGPWILKCIDHSQNTCKNNFKIPILYILSNKIQQNRVNTY